MNWWLRDWVKKSFRLSIVESTNESDADFMFEIEIDLKRRTLKFDVEKIDDEVDDEWLSSADVIEEKANARIFFENWDWKRRALKTNDSIEEKLLSFDDRDLKFKKLVS